MNAPEPQAISANFELKICCSDLFAQNSVTVFLIISLTMWFGVVTTSLSRCSALGWISTLPLAVIRILSLKNTS